MTGKGPQRYGYVSVQFRRSNSLRCKSYDRPTMPLVRFCSNFRESSECALATLDNVWESLDASSWHTRRHTTLSTRYTYGDELTVSSFHVNVWTFSVNRARRNCRGRHRWNFQIIRPGIRTEPTASMSWALGSLTRARHSYRREVSLCETVKHFKGKDSRLSGSI